MIISFEGLPGTYKTELYSALDKGYHIKIKRYCDIAADNLFQSDPAKYSLTYELDRLKTIYKMFNENTDTNSSNNIITRNNGCYYDGLYALREVYVNSLKQRDFLDKYQMEVFQGYHELLMKKPDYIIYLYGNLDTSYKRAIANTDNKVFSDFDDYKTLHYQYEWVFDITNCKIPMYKVTIEDDQDVVLENIVDILSKIDNNIN
jgi:thymidylate kinase